MPRVPISKQMEKNMMDVWNEGPNSYDMHFFDWVEWETGCFMIHLDGTGRSSMTGSPLCIQHADAEVITHTILKYS